MSGVRPEPLALEVALAHYVASMPEGKSVALTDVAREFGCEVADVRSAYVAVADVEDSEMTTISGVALSEDGTRLEKYGSGGYEPGFRRSVRLSPVQARAALLALDLVAGAADPSILENLRNRILGATVTDVSTIEVGGIGDDDVPVVATVERARREGEVVEIRYPSGKEIRTRAVEPLLMTSIEGVWYMNAYCRTARAGRLFRLERILSARPTGETFTRREDVEIKSEFADIDPRAYATAHAVVRFSPTVARWMEERPEMDLIERHEDGAADYALYYSDPAWAAGRVMQYGGEAVVVEPEELRAEVRRLARAALSRNREGK